MKSLCEVSLVPLPNLGQVFSSSEYIVSFVVQSSLHVQLASQGTVIRHRFRHGSTAVRKVEEGHQSLFSSVQSLDWLGCRGGREGWFSRNPLPVLSAGDPCEQFWHGQGCPLFDVLSFGEAVMACDRPEPCKFPSLDSCQKSFLWTYKEVDLLRMRLKFLLSMCGHQQQILWDPADSSCKNENKNGRSSAHHGSIWSVWLDGPALFMVRTERTEERTWQSGPLTNQLSFIKNGL